MFTWAAIKLLLGGWLKGLLALAAKVPWYVWAGIITTLFAWWFYSNGVRAADKAGYARAHEECIVAQAKADAAAVANWMATQTWGNAKAAQDLAASDARRKAAEEDAKKAKAGWAAAVRAKPLPAGCVLDDARVEAANAALRRK